MGNLVSARDGDIRGSTHFCRILSWVEFASRTAASWVFSPMACPRPPAYVAGYRAATTTAADAERKGRYPSK